VSCRGMRSEANRAHVLYPQARARARPRTVRHSGHLLEWSCVRAKQSRQKECPHGVVTGSNSRLEHRLHSRSSHISTVRALLARMQHRVKVDAYSSPRPHFALGTNIP